MKRFSGLFPAVATLLVLSVASGCSVTGAAKQPGGLMGKTFRYEVVAPERLPGPAREWIEQRHMSPSFAVWRTDEYTYFLAAAGERATGGYSLDVTAIGVSEGRVRVVVYEHTPKPGQPVTEAFTYPVVAARARNIPDLPIEFVLTTGAGGDVYRPEILR